MKYFNKNSIFILIFIFIFESQAQAMGAKRPNQNSVSDNFPTPVSIPNLPNLPPLDTPYVEHIKNLVSSSHCFDYNFKNRGRAPAGYIKGVALSFARSLCRFKKSRDIPSGLAEIMVMASTNNSKTDVIAYYQNILKNLNIDLNVNGEGPLRALYAIGIGLGMRESSGSYCEGWDKSAGSNRPATAAEAGPFQTSYDSIVLSPELMKLYNEYRTTNHNRCFLDVFQEGASCSNSSTLGTGVGADYQNFNKSCPAFATEYAMTMLRIQRSHYGPINRKEAEVVQSCSEMLKNVQDMIENDTLNACSDIE